MIGSADRNPTIRFSGTSSLSGRARSLNAYDLWVLIRLAIAALLSALVISSAASESDHLAQARLAAQAASTKIYVSIRSGSDSASGSKTRPLRTLEAAWERIPQGAQLNRPYEIILSPGRYTPQSSPNYWEARRGTASAPITIRSRSRKASKRAVIPSVNIYDVSHLTFDRIVFRDQFDLFHCELCDSVTVKRSSLIGSPGDLHENVKVNQSTDFKLLRSKISGADDNAVDVVAVQGARIAQNKISNSGDWCVYAKGGSADVVITKNVITDCGTGGVTAGQGTGLQFMLEPFTHYEAYRVEITDNDITETEGAAVGVNGGYQILIAGNRAWKVGSRSHWIEVTYGLRSCDGNPGDEGRERCQELLDDGAWGTTRVDDGTNAVRIPNRHVAILGNVIANPDRRGDQLFYVADPYSGSSQDDSGLGDVRADDDLRVSENKISGDGMPTGLPASYPANDFRAPRSLFKNPRAGEELKPRSPMPRWTAPSFPDDAPTPAEDQ